MNAHGSLFGGEATLFQSSVFKIYAANGALHFGRVADKFFQELMDSGGPVGGGAAGVVMKMAVMNPANNKRAQLVSELDALEPGGPEFLAMEKRNFTVRTGEILKAKLRPVTALNVGPGRIGFLELQLSNGKKRTFTLTGSFSSQEAESVIRSVIANAEGSLT